MSRKEVEKKLVNFGEKIVEDIKNERNPYMEIPVRSLSNIVFDEKSMLLSLGDKVAKRYFFNVAQARSFMQTLLVASFCKDIVNENIHTSIRDMYYNLKRTLPNSNENTFEEQSESDPMIIDLETSLDVLREQLHLIADRKGTVAGNVVIRDRGDEIDWSKLGSGGWSIPSAVEDIEFEKVKADFCLVIEKNAGFERLHEDKFWKKHNCILIGTGGQPARGTRRLIKRLSTEFKLPIYVMTDSDSIPPEEVVIVRDSKTKKMMIKPIGELLEPYMNENMDREIMDVPFETLAMDKNGKIGWKPVEYAYRHRINGELLEIHTEGRGIINVTPSHSLFVYRDGKIKVIRSSELKKEDYIVVARELPKFDSGKKECIIVGGILKKVLPKKEWNRIKLFLKNGRTILLKDAKEKDVNNALFVRHVSGYQKIFNRIDVDESLGWLLGLWVAEGDMNKNYVKIRLSRDEYELKERIEKIVKEKLNLETNSKLEGKRKSGIVISIGSSLLSNIFSFLGLSSGAGKKHIPSVVLNSPVGVQFAFIEGLFKGDGSIDKYQNIIYYTKSKLLTKQITNLLLSMGVLPTILELKNGSYTRLPYTRMPVQIRKKLAGEREVKVEYTNDVIYGLPNTGMVRGICINWMNNYGSPFSVKPKLINQQRFSVGVKNYGIPEKFIETSENLKPFLRGSITLVKVKKLSKKKFEGNVFDLAVPEVNSFIGGNGIVFHNSYGWYIYSVIKSGSMALAHASDQLGTPSAKFIGLTISDIDEYGLEKSTIKASERDIKRAKELLNYPWLQYKEWKREIKLMIDRKIKAEIEALSSRGLKFLSETYLPEKLEKKKFLP